MGGFKFQKIHPDMVRLGLFLVEGDILYNQINLDTMHLSSHQESHLEEGKQFMFPQWGI
jgi:hypothetical protein